MSKKSEARNARLDALEKASNEWEVKSKKRIDDEVALLKSILKGRTGSDRLAKKLSEAAQELVVAEMKAFLVG